MNPDEPTSELVIYRPEETPPNVVDAKTFHEEGVDPITGLTKMFAPPGSKLDHRGRAFIVEKIVAGWRDQPIVDALIAENYVLSFTTKAVAYYRRQPDVLALRARKDTEAMQVGMASRGRRQTVLSAMTEAMIKVDFRQNEDGTMTFLKDPDAKAQAAQAARVREVRENIKEMGVLIGDVDPRRGILDVNVTLSKKEQELGLENKSEEDRKRIFEQAVASLKKSEFIDAEFSVEEEIPKG